MADSPQVQPLPDLVEGGFSDLGAAAAADDPAAAAHPAAAVQDVPIHSHRLGRVLYILHISVTAELKTPCFMGPLDVGSWHEWKEDHLVALLGSVWTRVSYSYHTLIFQMPIALLQTLLTLPAAAATAAAEARSLFVIRVFPPVRQQQQQQQQHCAGQHTLIVQNSVEEKHEITYLVSRNQTKHAKLV